ncbi:MAG TPA: hypothetical protein VIC34_03690 [Croceibacterium sp.]|jgi:hypothetical protein
MTLPVLDLATLPELAHLTGAPPTAIFGNRPSAQMPGSDDSIVILATYVYETGGGAG